MQAIQVSFLDSVPNDLVIPWGFGCVAAAGMGVGTVFGSQRMTTTVGKSPVKVACNLFAPVSSLGFMPRRPWERMATRHVMPQAYR